LPSVVIRVHDGSRHKSGGCDALVAGLDGAQVRAVEVDGRGIWRDFGLKRAPEMSDPLAMLGSGGGAAARPPA